MDYNIDEIVKKEVNKGIAWDAPIVNLHIFGIMFYIWKKPEVHVELLETFPYAPDGEIPMIFIQLAWFEVQFEHRGLYKVLYEDKYGHRLDI